MDALDGHLRGPAPATTTSKAAAGVGAGAGPAGGNGTVAAAHGESKGGGGHDEAKSGAADEAGGAVETIAGVVMVGGRGAGRRALIEYVMLAGVNDTEECGRQLGELLKVCVTHTEREREHGQAVG